MLFSLLVLATPRIGPPPNVGPLKPELDGDFELLFELNGLDEFGLASVSEPDVLGEFKLDVCAPSKPVACNPPACAARPPMAPCSAPNAPCCPWNPPKPPCPRSPACPASPAN